MTRKIKAAKGLLSLSVSIAARELLISKSTETGASMSELADKLIVEAFRTKRGLAKRITSAQTETVLKSETRRKSASQALARATISADLDLQAEAKAAAERHQKLLDEAEYALQAEVIFEVNANNDLILKPQERFEYTLDEMLEGLTPEKVHGEINWGGPVGEEEWQTSPIFPTGAISSGQTSTHPSDENNKSAAPPSSSPLLPTEWQNSLQSLIIDLANPRVLKPSVDGDEIVRWFFDARIWCIAGLGARQSSAGLPAPRFFGNRIRGAIRSVVQSSQFPDKAMAADVAAELPSWIISTGQYDTILSHYNQDAELLYKAWLSEVGSEDYLSLMAVIKASDLVFGSGLAEAASGCQAVPTATNKWHNFD